MKKERLREIMLDQKAAFNRKSGLIECDIDLNKYISTQLIVIISGIRRCGKSSLLYLIYSMDGTTVFENNFLKGLKGVPIIGMFEKL